MRLKECATKGSGSLSKNKQERIEGQVDKDPRSYKVGKARVGRAPKGKERAYADLEIT